MGDATELLENLNRILSNDACRNYLAQTFKWLQANYFKLNKKGFKEVLKEVTKYIAVAVAGITVVTVAVIFIQWLLSFSVVSSAISAILFYLKTTFTNSWLFYKENKALINNTVSAIVAHNAVQNVNK